MAEENPDPFASILGALQSKGGERGVVKDSEGKVSPHLTPNETARYEKIFGIMKKVVAPGPEAGKVDRGGGGAAAKVANTSAMQKVKSAGGGLPGMGDILGLAGAAGIIGAAFTTMSDDFIARVKEFGQGFIDFGDATGDEFGKLGGLALKVGAKIGLKGLKMIPFLGSFVNFYYAIDHFKKEEYFDGAWELVSGIAGFFPGAGTIVSMLMDGVKIWGEIEANKQQEETGEKPSFANVLGQQATKIGIWFVDKLTKGQIPVLSTIYKFGEGIYYMFKGDLSQGLESWSHILPSLLGGKDSPVYKFVAGGLNTLWELTKENAPGAADKAVEIAGDAWGWIKDIFSDIGSVFMGFFDGIMGWINNTIQQGKDLIWNMIPDVLKPGKDKRLAEAQERAIAAGNRDDLLMQSEDIKAIMDRDPEAFAAAKGAGVAQFQSYLKSQGFKKVKDGMISKNGQVTRFDDQDDLLAAKRNGPIDKMLDGNSKVMKSIAAINEQQLNVLVEIRDGIRSLSSGGGISFNNNSLTEEFYAQ